MQSRYFSNSPARSHIKALFAALALLALSAGTSSAETVVIVNKQNQVNTLTASDLRLIYTGGKKMFADGTTVQPADLPPESPARVEFFERVLKKNPESYRLYWVRVLFSGKGRPPVEFKTEEEAVQYVASNKGGIAFVNAENVVPSVKVVRVTEEYE